MTRSSTPSKRPASSSAPGPAASSRGEGLRQRLAARRQVDQRRIGFVDAGVVDGGGEDIGAHHHAGAAARRRVVDGAVAPKAEVANGNGAQRPQPRLQRPADERDTERPGKHLREQRQHRCPPGRTLTFAWKMRHGSPHKFPPPCVGEGQGGGCPRHHWSAPPPPRPSPVKGEGEVGRDRWRLDLDALDDDHVQRAGALAQLLGLGVLGRVRIALGLLEAVELDHDVARQPVALDDLRLAAADDPARRRTFRAPPSTSSRTRPTSPGWSPRRGRSRIPSAWAHTPPVVSISSACRRRRLRFADVVDEVFRDQSWDRRPA